MSNEKLYPEAWNFFVKHARNMEGLPEAKIGKYRISLPDGSGDFIYNDKVEILFILFRIEFYKSSIKSPSIYNQIQYIVNNF